MSSSGLIYAFIVGAWAVYLVPMWLRREDELNKARQTQRYTTAIKVLSHKDSFERRYGRVAGAEEAERDEARLPVAVGQGAAPEAGRDTLERVRAKEREQAGTRRAAPQGARATKPVRKPVAAVPASSAGARRPIVRANVEGAAARSETGAEASAGVAAGASAGLGASGLGAGGSASAASAASSPMLRARRRRVVGVLFAVTSLGAIVSMDLGLRFVWAMLIPAGVLSAYIAWVRRDERARAAERARRRAAAAREARDAREAQRREQEAGAAREREQREAFERDDQARREAAARRRAAAARARAERRVSGPGMPAAPATLPGNPAVDPGDLPRAANG
jgi:hypothetical protein